MYRKENKNLASQRLKSKSKMLPLSLALACLCSALHVGVVGALFSTIKEKNI